MRRPPRRTIDRAAGNGRVAGRVRISLDGAVTIAGSELRLGMSVGRADTVVQADAGPAEHKELAKALLLAADLDMYRVKSEMRGASTEASTPG